MTSLDEIKKTLDAGGVCILPTETVYGLAADAKNNEAIDRIYNIKGRDFDKPLAVCVSGLAQAAQLASINPTAQHLAERFWPGSLTLVLPTHGKILDKRCYQGKTIALRCPDIDWRKSLTQTPLALTSANRSGKADATTAPTDLDVDAVLDGGPSPAGIASTILLVEGDKIKCLREGALKAESLSEFDIEWP